MIAKWYVVFEERPESATLPLVVTFESFTVEPYELLVPYSMVAEAATFVVHVIVAPLVVIPETAIFEIAGPWVEDAD